MLAGVSAQMTDRTYRREAELSVRGEGGRGGGGGGGVGGWWGVVGGGGGGGWVTPYGASGHHDITNILLQLLGFIRGQRQINKSDSYMSYICIHILYFLT